MFSKNKKGGDFTNTAEKSYKTVTKNSLLNTARGSIILSVKS